MSTMEYRLRNGIEQLTDLDKEAIRIIESTFNQLSTLTDSEAHLHKNRLIFLPSEVEIHDPSNIKINSVKRHRIDYISKLKNEKLKECLKKLKKEYNLGQGELDKITRMVKNVQKSRAQEYDSIEKIINFTEEYTEQVVNEKQVEKYVRGVETYCDKLKDSLILENPEILPEKKKKEVINKIDVLQSYIDDFRINMNV